MPKYDVVSLVENIYTVDADSPDEAAMLVEEGESGVQPRVEGAWVDKVTRPDRPTDDDLRTPGYCEIHKRQLRPGSTCHACYLDRLRSA